MKHVILCSLRLYLWKQRAINNWNMRIWWLRRIADLCQAKFCSSKSISKLLSILLASADFYLLAMIQIRLEVSSGDRYLMEASLGFRNPELCQMSEHFCLQLSYFTAAWILQQLKNSSDVNAWTWITTMKMTVRLGFGLHRPDTTGRLARCGKSQSPIAWV